MKKNHCCYCDPSIGLVTKAKRDKQVKYHVKTWYVMAQILLPKGFHYLQL
jgi:hypothetical protein